MCVCVCVRLLTNMAVVEPDSVAVIFAVTLHGIVGKVALSHFIIGINHNLESQLMM